MVETREIRLDVTEAEKNVLLHTLGRGTIDTGLKAATKELKARIKLAWMEAEFRDEADAHNDWVNREMYGREVEPDPDVVVRYIDGRNVVVRR